jgi:hypothetical protein
MDEYVRRPLINFIYILTLSYAAVSEVTKTKDEWQSHAWDLTWSHFLMVTVTLIGLMFMYNSQQSSAYAAVQEITE